MGKIKIPDFGMTGTPSASTFLRGDGAWVAGGAGTSGTSGTSGAAGGTGTSGTSGTSGINGGVGGNGTSGSSGTSGTSGVNGSNAVFSGTLNYVSKFTGTGTTIGNSQIFDNGTNVGIKTTTPLTPLHVSNDFSKTDINERGVARFSSSDATNPSGFVIQLKGGAAQADRIVSIQTDEPNVVSGGKLALQPFGGNLLVGTQADNGSKLQVNGAATFASSVTASGLIRSNGLNSNPSLEAVNSGTSGFPLLQLNNTINSVSKFWNIENGRVTNGDLGFYNVNGNQLLIKENGAATFSSSVTANGGVFNGTAGVVTALTVNNTGTAANARTLIGFSRASSIKYNLGFNAADDLTLYNSNNTIELFKLNSSGAATFSSSVKSGNIQVAGTSGSYSTGDNPMIGLGNFPVTNDFGVIEMPFGDKMKFTAYHGYSFRVSNSGATGVDALNINIDRTATFSSSVTATNFLSTYGSGENNILLGNSADMGANSFPLSIAAPAGTSVWPFGIIKGGTPIFRINNNGDVLTSGAATFTSSVTASSFIGNATTATNISNSGTVTLASPTENNEITVTSASGQGNITRGINFRWYDTNWRIGNARGGSVDSQGFSFDYNGVRKAVITTSGEAIFNSSVTAVGGFSFKYGAGLDATDYTYSKILRNGYDSSDQDFLDFYTAGNGVGNAARKFRLGNNGAIFPTNVTAPNYFATSTIYLPSVSNSWFSAGTGDGASYTTYNAQLNLWNSLAFYNPTGGGAFPNQVSGYLDSRAGTLFLKGAITASAFYQVSDIRYKDLVEKEYDENISEIKAITYTWKNKANGSKKQVGYSAQEVQKYLPDAIEKDEEGFLSVNYIQVLVAKIEELENKLKHSDDRFNDLENRLKKLENGINN
jgi:hypothetical protein